MLSLSNASAAVPEKTRRISNLFFRLIPQPFRGVQKVSAASLMLHSPHFSVTLEGMGEGRIPAADIRACRKHLRESQTTFAARFDVDRTTLATWERVGSPVRGPARLALERIIRDTTNGGDDVDGGASQPAS